MYVSGEFEDRAATIRAVKELTAAGIGPADLDVFSDRFEINPYFAAACNREQGQASGVRDTEANICRSVCQTWFPVFRVDKANIASGHGRITSENRPDRSTSYCKATSILLEVELRGASPLLVREQLRQVAERSIRNPQRNFPDMNL